MINKIINGEELKGKMIIDQRFEGGELWLKFSDGGFSVFTIEDVTEGFSYSKQEIVLSDDPANKTDYTLVKLGLLSEMGYNQAVKEASITYNQYIIEQNLKRSEELKRLELAQLEELKRKYE